MSKLVITLYGLACYCLFLMTFIYIEGFLLEIVVPKSINSGLPSDITSGVIINLTLIFSFGFFHSLMSRHWFKQQWTKLIPEAAERSTYVLQASLFLALLLWQWQPMPDLLWSFEGHTAWIFYVFFAFGNIVILWSIFLIDHFELFGLRQIWHNQIDKPLPKVVFKTPSLYKIVRHPMQLGTLIIFWSTSNMTVGHFLLALSMTLYILIGLWFEERSLRREFGEEYVDYQTLVPMLIPRLDKLCIKKNKAILQPILMMILVMWFMSWLYK